MIEFPNAKINLGLRIRRKRSDGFHDIETVMYPLGLCDVLEILEEKTGETTINCSGLAIDAARSGLNEEPNFNGLNENLVLKVYELLKKDFMLPPVSIHLHKAIPAGAGLGGGSSDCAFALKMIDKLFNLRLTNKQQVNYVSQLGSDCAFFLENKPLIATGRGEILQPVHLNLYGFYIYLVKPPIHINTGQAYSWVKPSEPSEALPEIIKKPVKEWKNHLINDFEPPVFEKHPQIRVIKEKLYSSGAVYAAMSGSGSALFGIFGSEPSGIDFQDDCFQWKGKL